ncbi:MAG: hypothetical protein WC242_00635 [Candidatus Paceibacterota bacterium]|jgi:predicted metal-dependent HD superfamily phosphohydrolase
MNRSPETLTDQERTKLEIMQEDFCNIFDGLKRPEAIKLFEKIVGEYQAEDRAYHNLEHIENLLAFLKEREADIKELNGIKLAAWFHDVVHDTSMRDNDDKSALFAKNYLEQIGVPDEVVEYVVALIQATAGHRVIEDNPDSAIFMDGDLAILGSSEEIYDQYAAKIRKEYEWVSEDQYRAERIKVLKGFLERPRIYITERANKELEQQARKNIEREIAMLSQ